MFDLSGLEEKTGVSQKDIHGELFESKEGSNFRSVSSRCLWELQRDPEPDMVEELQVNFDMAEIAFISFLKTKYKKESK